MIIRKKYKFEAAHIVRNCSTERCSKTIHGHSYIVEIFLKSTKLDDADMVLDFGLMYRIKEFIDMFDHAYLLWDKEDPKFHKFINGNCKRVITLPFSPTAERLAIFFHYWTNRILNKTQFANGEGVIEVHSVRVHETETGYAETERNVDSRFMTEVYCDFVCNIREAPKWIGSLLDDRWPNKKWENKTPEKQIKN